MGVFAAAVEFADGGFRLSRTSPGINYRTDVVRGVNLLLSQLMKDFFLLGRGELFLAFIDLSQNFMNVPPSATTQHGELATPLFVGHGYTYLSQ